MPDLARIFSKMSPPRPSFGSSFGASETVPVEEFSSLSFSLLQTSSSTAKRSNSQRQMVQDIAMLEQHIQAAARQSAENSRQTAERTEAVARDTERGNALMETTTAAMHQMSRTARESASLMGEFVLRMAEVSRVVETVRDIARQTNLLALNAAVEAAHAGTHGDGFTVIAGEIRALADRARQSTAEIASSIDSMAKTAHTAEKTMQVGEQAADISIKRNIEVDQALRSIGDAMQQVQSMSADVAGASQRQIAAVERLSAHIKQIDGMALESTYETDAAAEMSALLVLSAAQLGRGGGRKTGFRMHLAREKDSGPERLLLQLANAVPRVHDAIDLLRSELANAGAPRVTGELTFQGRNLPSLQFGGVAAKDATPMVDRVNQRSGCVATIFVRDAADFVRVATNVKRPDGQRATGTVLNPKGKAMARLARRMPHEGVVFVLGKPFVAVYEPVLSAAGDVLGALYVGLPLDQ